MPWLHGDDIFDRSRKESVTGNDVKVRIAAPLPST